MFNISSINILTPPQTQRILQEQNNIKNIPELEQIFPRIYMSMKINFWTSEKLRSHGFTHIINIDKNSDNLNTNFREFLITTNLTGLELNFGDDYLTAVLPNCYKAVKFLDKALKHDNTILILEKNGYQKCITIVAGFLMFKYNLKFTDAFAIIKKGLSYVELDKYYKTQLYEYEPILQVQRTQLCGHSCSGEHKRSSLKRKKAFNDEFILLNIETSDRMEQ